MANVTRICKKIAFVDRTSGSGRGRGFAQGSQRRKKRIHAETRRRGEVVRCREAAVIILRRAMRPRRLEKGLSAQIIISAPPRLRVNKVFAISAASARNSIVSRSGGLVRTARLWQADGN